MILLPIPRSEDIYYKFSLLNITWHVGKLLNGNCCNATVLNSVVFAEFVLLLLMLCFLLELFCCFVCLEYHLAF